MKILNSIVLLLLANLQILLANAGNAVYSINNSNGADLPPPMGRDGSGGPGSQAPLPIDNYAMLLIVIALLIITGYVLYSKKYKIV